MHDPVEVHPEEAVPEIEPIDAMTAIEQAAVVSEPKPVSPIGFTTVAGMVGVALGIILAPWLERWRTRLIDRKDESEEK